MSILTLIHIPIPADAKTTASKPACRHTHMMSHKEFVVIYHFHSNSHLFYLSNGIRFILSNCNSIKTCGPWSLFSGCKGDLDKRIASFTLCGPPKLQDCTMSSNYWPVAIQSFLGRVINFPTTLTCLVDWVPTKLVHLDSWESKEKQPPTECKDSELKHILVYIAYLLSK